MTFLRDCDKIIFLPAFESAAKINGKAVQDPGKKIKKSTTIALTTIKATDQKYILRCRSYKRNKLRGSRLLGERATESRSQPQNSEKSSAHHYDVPRTLKKTIICSENLNIIDGMTIQSSESSVKT